MSNPFNINAQTLNSNKDMIYQLSLFFLEFFLEQKKAVAEYILHYECFFC